MVKILSGTLYSCPCGYETLSPSNSMAHSKTKKCLHHTMVKTTTEFVMKSDYDNKGGVASAVSIEGNHHNISIGGGNIDNSVVNITTNINFVLPSGTTKEDFIEFAKATQNIGFRPPERIVKMPGVILTLTRCAKKLPGALVERGNKIFEKLPGGGKRVMAKKKAVQTYTQEAIEAMCLHPPDHSISEYLDIDRGYKRTKMSIRDAAKLRVTNPPGYHRGVPDLVKINHQRIESYTGECLDAITTENKANGFL